MRKSKFSESQKEEILSKHNSGLKVGEICYLYEISPATFYNWKKQLNIKEKKDKQRIQQLEQINGRLEKAYSELAIDFEILKEGYDRVKKISAQAN